MQRPGRPLSRMPRAALKGWEVMSNLMSSLGPVGVINANASVVQAQRPWFLKFSYRFRSIITLSTFFLEVTLLGHEKWR